MVDAVVVFCTCSDETEANRLAAGLLERRLAACVTILPEVKSVYRWCGTIEASRELMLMIKTTHSKLQALQDFILSIHSYDTPEILALPVVAGSERYLAWLRDEAGDAAPS
jgi:periplasmic divalent cation tolerance protein